MTAQLFNFAQQKNLFRLRDQVLEISAQIDAVRLRGEHGIITPAQARLELEAMVLELRRLQREAAA